MNLQKTQFAVRMADGHRFEIPVFRAAHGLNHLGDRRLNRFCNNDDTDQHEHHIDEENPEGDLEQGGAQRGLVF